MLSGVESFDGGVATTTRGSSNTSANNGTDVDDTFNGNPSTFISGGFNVIGDGMIPTATS